MLPTLCHMKSETTQFVNIIVASPIKIRIVPERYFIANFVLFQNNFCVAKIRNVTHTVQDWDLAFLSTSNSVTSVTIENTEETITMNNLEKLAT